MRLFLSIMEGPTPAEARPLIATSDPAVIAAVVRELMSRLEPGRVRSRLRELVPREKPISPEPGQ